MSRHSVAQFAPHSSVDGHHLTSGDMARMLHVDLKTIHNWVIQGHLTGRRTKGRHLRFGRTEVVRFMRQYGYTIPESVGAAAPRVVVDQPNGEKQAWVRTLKRGSEVLVLDGLFECALEVASGEYEVLVINLDEREGRRVRELLAAIRGWSLTSGMVVVGIGNKPAHRRSFLGAGGDVALPGARAADVRHVVRWVTGVSDAYPDAIETKPER